MALLILGMEECWMPETLSQFILRSATSNEQSDRL
jgi:hypothetical protein